MRMDYGGDEYRTSRQHMRHRLDDRWRGGHYRGGGGKSHRGHSVDVEVRVIGAVCGVGVKAVGIGVAVKPPEGVVGPPVSTMWAGGLPGGYGQTASRCRSRYCGAGNRTTCLCRWAV
jgi:hypothetical protein